MTQREESDSRRSPSSVPVGERFIVRVYIDGAADPEVYENVKHCWVEPDGPVLTILHYWAPDAHRYVRWPLHRVRWWQLMPMRFEEVGR